MTLATFMDRSGFVRSIPQQERPLNQMAARDFESAASTIPPLGQVIATAAVYDDGEPAASGPLNTALNIHVPGRFCSLTPSHLSLLAALEAQREHDARRRA